MKIKVINKSKQQLYYSTEAAAGMDLRVNLEKEVILKPVELFVNFSNEKFVIEAGERTCQMIISKHEKAELESVQTLLESERVIGGFGHTGKN
jgi:dUTP pyrophosphatase